MLPFTKMCATFRIHRTSIKLVLFVCDLILSINALDSKSLYLHASNIIFNLPLQKNQLNYLLCSTQIYDKMTTREGKIMRDNIILVLHYLNF